MRFSTAVAFAFTATASLVAAQDKCDAQNILDTCVAGYQSRIDGCNQNPNDFICLCDVYRDVLVCYNNCPNSNEKPPVQNQVTQYCAAADPLRAAASASAASIASIAATQVKSTSSVAAATGSSTSPAATAFKTNGATAFGAPAGAALVGFLAAAGLL